MGHRHPPNRREFLQTAGAAIAVPYVITSSALGNADVPPASDRIVMGGIGIGSQGSNDQGDFLKRPDVQYIAVSDVRKSVRDKCKSRIDGHYKNTDCTTYNDFRELLARPDIDAVHIATPDHWHAIVMIEACRNGKDVYCQKPETRTLREGPLMIDAARRYSRVASGGSQRVLEDYKQTVDRCWSGELGPIKSINVNVGPLSQQCNLPAEPQPDDIDWDMWLGPAPWCVAARRGGEQPEVNDSVRRMTNSIRPVVVASLLVNGEAQMTHAAPRVGCGRAADRAVSPRDKTRPSAGDGEEVVGDGMVGRFGT